MSAQLLQWVGDCFMIRGVCAKKMHCLRAVSGGSASPQRTGSSGSVLGVVRALGVLVSEGRVQGPPRGYKEGPHCAAPLQPTPNNHVCEKDNYLCDRYVILVREIADRVTACSYICVEVLLCTDCPCGLAKATCKDPVLPIPSMSIAQWQQSSEMLLEYWCISVIPSKGPETMNNQSLYQAVRSRLHFSQVAAWWSRSKGVAPSYITTRVVSFSEDNLRKFREAPSEHTFPLAACGDGNSIKVTVWALPRLEDVPILTCLIHPTADKEEEGAARALTPTKNSPAPLTSSNPEALVLPTLVDDRLQTPCNEPGKHHCRCEEEDGCPPSPSLRANGERKRRRSLPRGPDFIPCSVPHTTVAAASVLPSVDELTIGDQENRINRNVGSDFAEHHHNETSYLENQSSVNTNVATGSRSRRFQLSALQSFGKEESSEENPHLCNEINTNDTENSDGSLEKSFSVQLSMEEQESNIEKRYKCSVKPSVIGDTGTLCKTQPPPWRRDRSPKFHKKNSSTVTNAESGRATWSKMELSDSEQLPSFKTEGFHNTTASINWTTSTISGKESECGYDVKDKVPFADSVGRPPIINGKANFVVNPFGESSPFHESNPGPSTYNFLDESTSRRPDVSGEIASSSANDDLSQLLSKWKFPDQLEESKDEKGILGWISKVPSRVFGVATNNSSTDCTSKADEDKGDDRVSASRAERKQNCGLELSQREFDEVLAVLRARTPAGRRRTPSRTIRRREKLEKQSEESIAEDKPDVWGTPTNINVCNYAARSNTPKILIADRLGNAKFHTGDNNQSPLCPENREPMDTLSKGSKRVIYSYGSMRHGKYKNLDKQDAKPLEPLFNETSKADVLMDAILRTSKDPRKGLSDISNGARPRTLPAPENHNGYKVEVQTGKLKNVNKVSSAAQFIENDKSIPCTINERIGRIRQLFRKEQGDKNWDLLALEDCSKECATRSDQFLNTSKFYATHDSKFLLKNSKDSRVKRKIDFSNLSVDQKDSFDESNRMCRRANGIYQNPLFNGISYGLQNTSMMKIKEFTRAPEVQRESREKEDHRYIPRELKTPSTKLKLRIGRGERNHDMKFDCVNYSESHNGCNAVSNPNKGSNNGNSNYSSAELHKQTNYVDSKNSDAPEKGVPSAIEQEQFRRSFGNAASMVFHSRTGLPLTSSPAPLRRGSCCFDYDSSLNSVSSKRSALFELNTPPSPGAVSLEEGDREADITCEGEEAIKRRTSSRVLPHSHALLGSFEESALNGRLEPVSTVHGFTAELGASGSFCPKHRKLPVTVFFYTLGDNDKVSTPYLAHINLGKKGYQVPRSGTIQVTLLNPLGTVVKMFVVMYDLSDMPTRSHTFLRQRTLRDKTLRYLIHLRFMSGKSGRIYLHTDIRMIICRKSDVDTASDLGAEPPKELRSFVRGPTNPKFSPRC
ncbi:uncharacterized protein LOC105689371 isoform X2 [Athalia rosae]|uniref:uncharacterized protein LOC105689371 isoform X2 n=1 Tax=Athalia rosae TaxID=37344 RepID=UPI002033B930|nr:uncharacterized protein LOC105689371 isoform X2 [Athalia rosae]